MSNCHIMDISNNISVASKVTAAVVSIHWCVCHVMVMAVLWTHIQLQCYWQMFLVWECQCSTCVSSWPSGVIRALGVDLPSVSTGGALSLPQECARCIPAWCWALGCVGLLPPSTLFLLARPGSGAAPWAGAFLKDRLWRKLLGVSYHSLSRLGIWYSSLCPWDALELHLEAHEPDV